MRESARQGPPELQPTEVIDVPSVSPLLLHVEDIVEHLSPGDVLRGWCTIETAAALCSITGRSHYAGFSCGSTGSGFGLTGSGAAGAAMARVFVLKLGVLPDRVLVPLLNDRMVAKVRSGFLRCTVMLRRRQTHSNQRKGVAFRCCPTANDVM